nr:IclR family transcriptional regulator [Acetobacter conturbans]
MSVSGSIKGHVRKTGIRSTPAFYSGGALPCEEKARLAVSAPRASSLSHEKSCRRCLHSAGFHRAIGFVRKVCEQPGMKVASSLYRRTAFSSGLIAIEPQGAHPYKQDKSGFGARFAKSVITLPLPLHRGACPISAPKLIQSVERALAVLEIIAREGGAARLQDIAALSGVGKTTIHNILITLRELGYVHRRPGDMRYHLGGRILNLARMAGDDEALRTRLRPVLETIAGKTGETVYLAVPSGDEVHYLDAIESSQALRCGSPVGECGRLENSAIGLVFLAFMPGLRQRVLATRAEALGPTICAQIETVRTHGFALDRESHLAGLNCVAVPWREGGEVRASIGLSGPSSRLSPKRLSDIAWMIMREAEIA